MKVLIALEMYDVDEIRKELPKHVPKYAGKTRKYSTTRVQFLIKDHLPMAERIGRRYLLTERQLKWLATRIKPPGRPKKVLANANR